MPAFGEANGWMSGDLSLCLLLIFNAVSAVGRALLNWLANLFGAVIVVIPNKVNAGIYALTMTKRTASMSSFLIAVVLFWNRQCPMQLVSPALLSPSAWPQVSSLPCRSFSCFSPRTMPISAPGWGRMHGLAC